MNVKSILPLALISLICLASAARAQAPRCDVLSLDQKRIAEQIMQKEHPYECCDDTIAACLKQKKVCPLALRLADNICRRVSRKESAEQISRALYRRAQSAMPGQPRVAIALQEVPVAGKANAPITLVEYACARCPYCSKITPEVYRAVTEGELKGKVKLYFKLFPIRGHLYGKEGGLALLAAAKLGKFWEYAVYFFQRFDDYSPDKQSEWAEKVGMKTVEFEQAVNDPATRDALIKSKKEGIVNRVEATPTFFINGIKYSGEVRAEELIDFLQEEFERVSVGKK